MIDGARRAGALLLRSFGRATTVRVKENPSSIVTEADLASEQMLVELIRSRFPDHGILGEEGGHLRHGSEHTWILDPLDGTSNFASGLPWFGVMIGVLRGTEPVLGCMYLPVEDRFYVAERGAGATCNGVPIQVAQAQDLSTTLCACAMDPAGGPERIQRQARLLGLLVEHARNVRATNSLVDFAATADGRLGACVNFSMKLWDIAAPLLILQEAGGACTGLDGQALPLDLGPGATERSYPVVGGGPALARRVLELAAQAGLSDFGSRPASP